MNTPDLEFIACPTSNCGGQWLPATKVRQLRESHETFYCPSGHSQFFGQSDKEKLIEQLKKQLQNTQDDVAYWREQYYRVSKEKRTERRKQYALKGVITRMKKAS
jgi:hypothetical protein